MLTILTSLLPHIFSFLKRFWRETFIVLLLFVCFMLWKHSKDTLEAHLALEMNLQKELVYFKDQHGQAVAQKEAVVLTVEELRTLHKYGNQKIDSLSGVVKRLSRLNSDLNFTISSQNTLIGILRKPGIPPVIPRQPQPVDSADMIPNPFPRIADYSDGFLTAATLDTGDSLKMDYTYQDQFQATIYLRKPGLLKKKTWVVDIKAKNPKTKITSANVVVIKDNVTLWKLIKAWFTRN